MRLVAEFTECSVPRMERFSAATCLYEREEEERRATFAQRRLPALLTSSEQFGIRTQFPQCPALYVFDVGSLEFVLEFRALLNLQAQACVARREDSR